MGGGWGWVRNSKLRVPKRKRSDLRVYGANNKVILAGEVKLPGTAEGRNAYSSALVDDSYQKASNIGAEFFFTWNVNKLVLFDAKKWHLPIMERRVKDYDLGLDLDNLLEVPDPRNVTKAVAKKLQDALKELSKRDTQPLVEEEFMDCRDLKLLQKLIQRPISLPWELQQPDRRALDLAVFELLGVADAKEREALCDELYHETAAHFRQIRVVEIQKQKQRAGGEGGEFRTDELAADLWDSLPETDKQPLAAWIAGEVADGLTVNIPEGHASLPDASDFLDANTVFFRQPTGGKAVVQPLALPSRAHAEMVHLLAQRSVHGTLPLPKTEKAAQSLQVKLTARLAALAATANELSRSRTGDEKKALELAHLIEFWMVHGRPSRETKQKQSADKAGD